MSIDERQVFMVFWDVQHGHSTYIRSPNGKHIVIDLGVGSFSNGEDFSPLAYLRNYWGVRQLDYAIITHPHRDHIDDIQNFWLLQPRVLARPTGITDKQIMEGVRQSEYDIFSEYCAIGRQYNSPVEEIADDPNNPENFGGMRIQTFFPNAQGDENFNNHSIITVVEYAGVKVVIPGDNEISSLEKLMKGDTFKDAIKNADILLAPHHGRESAYHNEFVSHVNPRLTIISDGSRGETSANQQYSQKSRGWQVHKKGNGTSSERKCLTTNSDGVITAAFGYNQQQVFLNVEIE